MDMGEFDHSVEGLDTADQGADGNEEDLTEMMALIATGSRIFDYCKGL